MGDKKALSNKAVEKKHETLHGTIYLSIQTSENNKKTVLGM